MQAALFLNYVKSPMEVDTLASVHAHHTMRPRKLLESADAVLNVVPETEVIASCTSSHGESR